MQRLLALVLLILLSPVLVTISIAIVLSDGRPIFYRAKRVGREERLFDMLKFRTMVTESQSASAISASDDPRATRVGRFLRRCKLDELPQLINIIRGDMAFVGSRPEAPEIVERHFDASMKRILEYRPGLTSPGTLFNETRIPDRIEDAEAAYVRHALVKRIALDLDYEAHRTAASDIALVFRTMRLLVDRAIGRAGA